MASGVSRAHARRAAVLAEILDTAEAVMTELGVGGLSLAEVARRMGMRSPSLYKHVASLEAVYDALFARALQAESAAVAAAVRDVEPGVEVVREGGKAVVAWCVAHPALAQLLHWRAVPDFEPTATTFAASTADMADLRAMFAEAVRRGELSAAADSADAVRLYTVVLSGLVSQQMANEPGRSFARGSFSRLTDEALTMFLDHYRP